MEFSARPRPTTALIAAIALLVATGATAAVTKEEGKCQAGAAKAAAEFRSAELDVLRACHDAIGRGALDANTDCRSEASTVLAAAAAELSNDVLRVCDDAVVGSLLYGADCEDSTTAATLADCLLTSARAGDDLVVATLYASPALPADAQAAACREAAGAQALAYAAKASKTLQKCRNKASREKVPVGTRCVEDAKVVRKLAKLAAKVARKAQSPCPPAAVAGAAPGVGCDASATVTELAACYVAAVDRSVDAEGLVAYGDGAFCGDSLNAVESTIDSFFGLINQADKIEQMAGTTGNTSRGWPTPDLFIAGMPGLRMLDGPRGVGKQSGRGSAFPVGMARGATWDTELEERVGAAIGAETRAKGASVLLAPVTTVVRHPRWGRSQESYGEDPMHLGAMGTAFVHGAQRHVVASLKHFAVNSIEDTRFNVNVTVDERTLREIYLPHFHDVVTEGRVASVMSAYNKVNGAYCAENSHLLRDILKGEWGFRGFVESDWILGTRSTVASALAGLDIEMPFPEYFAQDTLGVAVTNGDVPIEVVDEAVRRNLRVKYCFRLKSDPPLNENAALETAETIALTREVARKGIVLLENDGDLLPLDPTIAAKLVVLGPLADAENIGDTGSSDVAPSDVVTILEGITAGAGAWTVQYLSDGIVNAADQAMVSAADAVLYVAGFSAADEGESLVGAGDRATWSLPAAQESAIAEVAALNPATIVVLEGGSTIGVEAWVDDVAALLMAWYPGMQGGNAVADLLFGAHSPSGKLPMVWASDESQMPTFINDQNEVTYEYWHGYRRLDHDGNDPRYPFGYGLSYTGFAYSNLTLDDDSLGPEDTLTVRFDVTNTGTRAGEEVAQAYTSYPGSGVERPVIDLRAFARVALEPGQTSTVSLEVPVEKLAYYDTAAPGWALEAITYGVHVGGSSRDLPLSD
jgi:beta-glucosidase